MSEPRDMAEVVVRAQRVADTQEVYCVESAAFGGEAEAKLCEALAAEGAVTCALVAQWGEQLVGHLLFSRLRIVSAERALEGWALAPLAVLPDWQRRGVGTRLMHAGLEEAKRGGAQWIIVFGWPDYYSRFGFSASAASHLDTPYPGPHFMGLELVAGTLDAARGRVTYARAFEGL